MQPEPSRTRPGAALAAKMSTLARADTAPEMALRRELHKRGMRFRVQLQVPENRRRRIDVAFTRARVAVFVDGCFWHSCPEHGTLPRANRDWWTWKLDKNQARDEDTTRLLERQGWLVMRIWEHEPAVEAADRIEALVRRTRCTQLPALRRQNPDS